MARGVLSRPEAPSPGTEQARSIRKRRSPVAMTWQPPGGPAPAPVPEATPEEVWSNVQEASKMRDIALQMAPLMGLTAAGAMASPHAGVTDQARKEPGVWEQEAPQAAQQAEGAPAWAEGMPVGASVMVTKLPDGTIDMVDVGGQEEAAPPVQQMPVTQAPMAPTPYVPSREAMQLFPDVNISGPLPETPPEISRRIYDKLSAIESLVEEGVKRGGREAPDEEPLYGVYDGESATKDE